MINKYDIVGIHESKTDDCDEFDIPGFKVVFNNREKLSSRKSGGIVLLIKEEYFEYIQIDTKQQSKLVQWFSISHLISPITERIYCGVVYLPPQGSRYANEDPYTELQQEILRYCQDSNNIILMGDFNSRTGEKADYTCIDPFISDMYGLEILTEESQSILNFFSQHDVPFNRLKKDKIINNYGNQMLEFCKLTDLFILNGRIRNSVINLQNTCKDRSTVDYFLSTSKLFGVIEEIDVLEYSNLFSDVHCPISLCLKAKNRQVKNFADESLKSDHVKTKLWDDLKQNHFQSNINLNRVAEISSKLTQLSEKDTISKYDINNIANDISSMFESCAKATFGTFKTHIKEAPVKKKKTWFSLDCRNARDRYHNARKFYNKYKSEEAKINLNVMSKKYKKTILTSINKSRQVQIEKLRNLKSKNSRE